MTHRPCLLSISPLAFCGYLCDELKNACRMDSHVMDGASANSSSIRGSATWSRSSTCGSCMNMFFISAAEQFYRLWSICRWCRRSHRCDPQRFGPQQRLAVQLVVNVHLSCGDRAPNRLCRRRCITVANACEVATVRTGWFNEHQGSTFNVGPVASDTANEHDPVQSITIVHFVSPPATLACH